jgi:hypothetical protein
MTDQDPRLQNAAPPPATTTPPKPRRDHVDVAKSWLVSWLIMAVTAAPIYAGILTFVERQIATTPFGLAEPSSEPVMLSIARHLTLETVTTAILFFFAMSLIAGLARLVRRRK